MKIEEIWGLTETIDLNRTIEKYGGLLSTHAAGHNPEKVIKRAITIDPTPQGKYVQWVLRRYIDGGIKHIEDFAHVGNMLTIFDKRKAKLPTNHRDIQQITSLQALEGLTRGISSDVNKSGKEIKRDEKTEVMRDVRVIYSDPRGKILAPTTEESSCLLGRGTKWCTAGVNVNKFSDIIKHGQIYVILTNDKRKFQFQLDVDGGLKNETDDHVDYEEFDEKYPWVFENLNIPLPDQLDAVQKTPRLIQFINSPSEKIQLAAITKDPEAIQFIRAPSEAAQVAAVDERGWNIHLIKNPTERVQLVAVSHVGNAIRMINNPSDAVQLAAVRQNPNALSFIDYPSKAVERAAQ